MDKIEKYLEIVKNLIHNYAKYKPSHGQIATEVITDIQNDHYELMHIG